MTNDYFDVNTPEGMMSAVQLITPHIAGGGKVPLEYIRLFADLKELNYYTLLIILKRQPSLVFISDDTDFYSYLFQEIRSVNRGFASETFVGKDFYLHPNDVVRIDECLNCDLDSISHLAEEDILHEILSFRIENYIIDLMVGSDMTRRQNYLNARIYEIQDNEIQVVKRIRDGAVYTSDSIKGSYEFYIEEEGITVEIRIFAAEGNDINPL